MTLAALSAVTAAMFLLSASLVLFELLLTRLFGVVLFAQFAHLALALALLGIGIGSVIQHVFPSLIPEEKLEKRLAAVAIAQATSTLLAVVCVVNLPLTAQFGDAVVNFAHRGSRAHELLDQAWFALLLPVLMVPFAFAGLGFAGAFQRRKQHIGRLYGADLIGGAVAALLFIPALALLAGPDVVFASALFPFVAALLLYRSQSAKAGTVVAGAGVALCAVLTLISLTGVEVLRVRYAAGYAEDQVYFTQWTPLTRLALHDDGQIEKVLLDNSSASEIVRHDRDLQRLRAHLDRSTVYALHDPPARVAILAASAGPEVAIARSFGFQQIDAVDIAQEIADVVAERFPDAPLNPYLSDSVRRVKADGRAAVLHAEAPYDIIQMVHANLHSNAGLLANAWSPSLLETQEAFGTYLDRLTPDGTISFARGYNSVELMQAAAAALEERGVEDPWHYVLYVETPVTRFVLIKKRPWTHEGRNRVDHFMTRHGFRKAIGWDPTVELNERGRHLFYGAPPLTDNRPYLDTPGLFASALRFLFDEQAEEMKTPYLVRVYASFTIQIAFVILAGFLFLFLPLFLRSRAGLVGARGLWGALAYVACLGYAYLAIETVLIHEFVLYVGHPTYAVTTVILAMLASSGYGSVVVGRWPEEEIEARLRRALTAVLILAGVQTLVMPTLMEQIASGLPQLARLFLTGLTLMPLGFYMGMPFPAAMRLLPAKASGAIPWAWAINGWMSVVASLLTMLISRNYGYQQAFFVGGAAYVVALLLMGRMRRVEVAAG